MKKNLNQLISLVLSLVLVIALFPATQANAASYSSISAGAYTIASKVNENYLLDVDGNKMVNKANVKIVNNSTQQFSITKTSGDWYSITPRSNPSYTINPDNNTPKSGTNVNIYDVKQQEKVQGFYFQKVGDYYAIRSAYDSSLALTVEGSITNVKNLTNVRLETYTGKITQLWKISKASVKSYTDADMQNAIKTIGKQTDNKKELGAICASFTIAYGQYLQTGKHLDPLRDCTKNGNAQWGWFQGTVVAPNSQADVLKKVKAQLDEGGLASIHVRSDKTGSEHWLLAYRYDNNGNTLSNLWVADPWSGSIKTLDKSGYSLYFKNGTCRVALFPHEHTWEGAGVCTICGTAFQLNVVSVSNKKGTITSVNNSDTAPTHTSPYGDAPIKTRYKVKASITVIAKTQNAYKNTWYQLSNGEWISGSYVKLK